MLLDTYNAVARSVFLTHFSILVRFEFNIYTRLPSATPPYGHVAFPDVFKGLSS